ncbi:MAG: AAA family ATPase [Xenococcus sp. MO_188.B8]|nr:AAA family ATPase [Xenococcus sp. MO_188.B8]
MVIAQSVQLAKLGNKLKLSIKKIKLKNLKNFELLEFEPNKNFNIIIGENNIGKSTIFEAIQLWERCYDFSIKADGRSFYKSEKGKKFISSLF